MTKLKTQISNSISWINQLSLPIQLLVASLIIMLFGLVVSISVVPNSTSSWFLVFAIACLSASLLLVQFEYRRAAGLLISLFFFTAVFFHSIWVHNSVNNATHASMVLLYAFWLVIYSEKEAGVIFSLIITYLIGFYFLDVQGAFGESISTVSDLFDILIVELGTTSFDVRKAHLKQC